MVDLAEEERVRLRTLLRRGKASVRMVARARVLLRAEEGYTDAAIAAVLDVGTATVGRIRKRFVERGLEQALREQPRPGQRRKLSGKQEAHCLQYVSARRGPPVCLLSLWERIEVRVRPGFAGRTSSYQHCNAIYETLD